MPDAPADASEVIASLTAGQPVLFGGDRVTRVTPELAAAFVAGDSIIVMHDTGELLHLPAAEVATVDHAVRAAHIACRALATVTDEQITDFFERAAERLADDDVFAPVAQANAADVASAEARGRATGRLVLSAAMRADMCAGLRMWAAQGAPAELIDEHDHGTWSVEVRRAPLGVVGFVFEGRPNVLTDACGVVRTRNAGVLRIGSDARTTARALIEAVIAPALADAGLPGGCVGLVDSAAHAAGWALFADRRVGLAIARGSGPAVAQLGAVARQHGVPASLHGTGGAWLVAGPDADAQRFAAAVRWSLDRKVCNTLNVCCIVAEREASLLPVFEAAVDEAAAGRGTRPIIHRLQPDDPRLATEWEWDSRPEVSVVVVQSVDEAVALCNRWSPRFVASLISDDPAEHERFYAAVDAPFVGDGLTRWVDGQFALGKPELGLSNWQSGRLFGRGGVLSGDGVFTLRLRARVRDPQLHR